MKPAPFDYVAPTTVEAACATLAEAGGGAAVLAGGQTLMPLMALRMSQPFIVVDVNRIAALQNVSSANGAIRIGPMLRQNDAIAHPLLSQALPMLVQAARHVGHHQTRNRGTIGGSICFGEPAAELPAAAVALGATIEARSLRGTRRIDATQFYQGPYTTLLEPDELVTAIEFPNWPAGTITLFREVARRPGDFALVGLVGALALEAGRVARAGIAWFGMGPTPIRARQAEAALLGQPVAAIDMRGVAEHAVAETDPFDDQHATRDYRQIVGRRVFARALSDALGSAQ